MGVRDCCFSGALLGFIWKHFSLYGIQTQHFSDAAEAAAVYWDGAEFFERATVFRCWVTFVRGKTVTLVESVHLEHVRVARGLSNYRGGSDARGKRVSADDAALRRGALGNLSRINQDKVRNARQPIHRTLHCQQAGVVDVYLVDLFNFSKSERPAHCILFDLRRKFFTRLMVEDFLRVIETSQLVISGQDHGSRYHRASKRRHSRFINAGHK